MRRRGPLLALTLGVALLGVALLASGCSELIDIDKKAMVVGVGLDAGPAPSAYQVSIQYLIPSGGGAAGGVLGGGGGSSAANLAVTASAPGQDVADAFRRLCGETDRFVYLGNVGVLVLGEALARQGVMAPLDFFLRDGEVAEATQVAVARGRALRLFSQQGQLSAGGVALPLFEFLSLGERAHFPTSPNVLWRFLGPQYSHNRSSYAPLVEPSTQGPPFREIGTALFLRGRMVGEVDGYDAAVLDWLIKTGGYPDAIVRLPQSAEPVALRVTQSRRRIRVLGPRRVALRLILSASVREGNGVVIGARDTAPLEREASRQIRRQVRRVLDVLQRDGTDVLHVNDRVFARYPGDASGWPERFSRLRIDLSVLVRIHEGGRKT